MDQATAFAGFEADGEASVRDRVLMGSHSPYNAERRALALAWLAKLDATREAEAEARRSASDTAQMDLQRRSTEAAEAAALSARTANRLAADANNIAKAAALIAMIAIGLSIWGLLTGRGP